jgi:purine-nucleoside phosphorylase
VEGHKGNLLFGTLNNVPVICMQGRFHPYEGYCAAVCTMPIKVFKFLGVKLMLLTNAAGGLNQSYKVGDLMILKDHLSYPLLSLNHPLVGQNDSKFGPRFLPINLLYDKDMRDLLKSIGDENRIGLHEGVYGVVGGPTYETVSDARLYVANGCDVVGMSTAHEAIVAKYCGMKVLALSIVTDMVPLEFDVPEASDHAEIVKVAKLKAKDVELLLHEFMKKLSENPHLI